MGIEPTGNSPEKTALSAESGAKSGALAAESDAGDPDLATLIDAWPRLPETIRAGILAMVPAATGAGDSR